MSVKKNQARIQNQDLSDIGIVLSLRDDRVWVSWLDEREPVLLGDHQKVLNALRDFIAQSDLGERLTNRDPQ